MIDSLIVMSEIANNENKRVHRKRNKNKQQEKTEYSKNAKRKTNRGMNDDFQNL